MRVAIYTRVSTDQQAEEGFSLEVQHEKLMEYVSRNKLEFFGFYTDPGVSAKNLNRPGIQSLLKDFNDDLFDIILVHKLDRLTRNIGDLHNLVEMVNSKGKKLISYTEDIDTSTPAGRMFVYFLGIIAQMFRENLGEEVTKGMRKRAQMGLHGVTVNMYGYERGENSELLIKEEEAKWVRLVFEQYLSGLGSISISRHLNRLGVRTNQGAKWNQQKIMNIIKNIHYAGKIHFKSVRDTETIIRDGVHEPIISEKIFNKARNILERKKSGLISLNSYQYIFGGILRCASCGGRYKGKSTIISESEKVIYRMYVCSNKEKFGECKQSSISERKLIELMFKSVSIIGKDYSRKDTPYTEKNEDEEIRKSIRISEERRERWQLAYGDGNMPYNDFSKRMKEEMIRMNELSERLSAISPIVSSFISPSEAIQMIDDLKENWNLLEASTHKEIIQSLFQEIVIRKEGRVWYMDNIILA